MDKILLPFFILILFVTGVCAEEGLFSAVPYKIKICVFGNVPGGSEADFTELVLNRCRLQAGQLWKIKTEFPAAETAAQFRCRLPDGNTGNTEGVDKIFIVELQSSGLRIQEFDVKTQWLSREAVYEIENPAKTIDVFLQALFETFSPIARLERATMETVTLRVEGADIDSRAMIDPNQQREKLVGITMKQSVLLPFVRAYDRDGKLQSVSQIPWTVLVAEQVEPVSNLLRCRIESSLRDALSARRRGQTEIYALSIPTPNLPTTLQFKSRISGEEKSERESTLRTLPIYHVFEAVPGEKELKQLGKTQADGTFVLEPNPNRPIQTLLVRNGNSTIAQFPIVRGLNEICVIPVPDDAVRLEAEAVLLGIQEDMIDTAARRSILNVRKKKFDEAKDEKMSRETQNELAKLKDNDRFLTELEQARRRFQSTDPVVQRRIDKLFREIKKLIK